MEHNGIPADAIEAELCKILASRTFNKADRASRFLRFVVCHSLEGKSSELKEYVVGVEVLGRNPDFDPRVDTIVRAEAKRLHTKLDEYYASVGQHDKIRISIPKGTYVPSFDLNGVTTADMSARDAGLASSQEISPAREQSDEPPVAWPKSPLRLIPLWLGLGAVAIAMLGFALFWIRPSSNHSLMYAGRPLTSYVGSEIGPSFSPDGDRVAFSWDGEGQDNFDIYIKQIDVETPLRLTADPRPDLSPAWSPDGRSVAFLRITLNGGADVLLTSSFVGGSEHKIADVAPPVRLYWRSRLISWSSDGKWLVVPDGQSSQQPIGLTLLGVASGEKRKLTEPVREIDLEPAFSPDMTRLAFVRFSSVGSSDLYLLELSRDLTTRAEPVRLDFRHRPAVSPVWAPDGRAILFARRPTAGSPTLWRMTLQEVCERSPSP
jgi:hypothetical protein